MFAQALITLATVWLIAELLCRLILARSFTTTVRELLGLAGEKPRALPQMAEHTAAGATTEHITDAPTIEPNATLRQHLADRRRRLAETGTRLELTMEAAKVAEQLGRREAELAVTEGRLAEIEKKR